MQYFLGLPKLFFSLTYPCNLLCINVLHTKRGGNPPTD